MRLRLINTTILAGVLAASMVAGVGSAAVRPVAPAGSGEPIAAFNAITADGTLAVGTDSISVFLNPLCGTDLSEHRTTPGWTALRTPSPACGWLTSVVALPHHRAWAVGYHTTKTGRTFTLSEFYNGSRWVIEPTPSPGTGGQLFGVAVSKSGTVWAVGTSETSDSVERSLVLKRTGSRWTVVPSPGAGAELHGVTVTPSGQVWAVGWQFNGDDLAFATVTMHLTGAGWQVVPSPSPGGSDNSYLYAVASGPHASLWAVGNYFDPATFAPHTLTMRYASGHWTQVASPSPGSAEDWLYAAAVTSAGGVWAVGAATGPLCESALAEEFTAGKWHAVKVPDRGRCDSIHPNALYAVAVAGKNVYAVGQADISTLAEESASGHWKIVRSGN